MLKRRAVAVSLIACGLWLADSYVSVTAAQVGAELPVRVIEITMAHHELEQFVTQISEFAVANALEIRVSQRSPDPEDILIQMWRNDVKLLAVPIIDPNILDLRYGIPIYANGDQPLPTTVVDQLVEDLQTTVKHLDKVTFAITQ